MSQFIDIIVIVRFDVQHSNYAINSIKKRLLPSNKLLFLCLFFPAFYSTGALN